MSELHPVGWELSSFLSCTITKAFNCTLYQPCRSLIYEATVIMTGIHHLHTPQAHASMYLQQILQSWVSWLPPNAPASDALVAQRPSRISLLGLHRKQHAPVIAQNTTLAPITANTMYTAADSNISVSAASSINQDIMRTCSLDRFIPFAEKLTRPQVFSIAMSTPICWT